MKTVPITSVRWRALNVHLFLSSSPAPFLLINPSLTYVRASTTLQIEEEFLWAPEDRLRSLGCRFRHPPTISIQGTQFDFILFEYTCVCITLFLFVI